MIKFLLLIAFLSLGSVALCQNPEFVEDFTLFNVAEGKEFTLREYESVPTVVVIFTDVQCPYARLYEDRIDSLVSSFQSDDIRFILVNSNSEDSKEAMVAFTQKRSRSVPYLDDRSKRVARLFGASKSPEAFVLSRHRKSFKIVYRGAIDDNPQVSKDVRHHYLRNFLEASGSGKTFSLRTTPASGCIL